MNPWTWRSAAALVMGLAASPAMAQTPILELALDEGSGPTAVNSGSLGAAADGAITASDALQILRIAVGTDEHTNVCNA